jgi:putative flippase GtrA
VRLLPVRLRGTGLKARWQKLASEFAKFGTVGVINALINYGVFNLLALTVLKQGELKANVGAAIVATTASYFMNRYWTYRDRPKSTMRREYTMFFVFNAAGLLIELSVLAIARDGLGITGLLALNIAKTVGVGLATIFRFWAYRTFVFPVGLAGHAPKITARTGGTTAPRGASEVAEVAGHAIVPVQGGTLRTKFDELTAPIEAELASDLSPPRLVRPEADRPVGSEADLDGTRDPEPAPPAR